MKPIYELKTFEIAGYIRKYETDIFLEKNKKNESEEYYYYPSVESLGSCIADHFKIISKPFDISFSDWRRGNIVAYKDIFLQYYLTKSEMKWDEIEEKFIKKLAGELITEDMRGGYSEYTITDSWTEIFVGGHDLLKELIDHEDEYVIIRINYKILK